MRQITAIAYYEMKCLLSSRAFILYIFVAPMLIIFLLGSGLSSFFSDKRVEVDSLRLALMMGDDGYIKPSLYNLLDSGEVGEVEVIAAKSPDQLKRMVETGEADAGLAVPEGFSDSLLQGIAPDWEFVAGKDALKDVVLLQGLHSFFDGWNHRFAELNVWDRHTAPPDVPAIGLQSPAEKTDYVRLVGIAESNSSYSALQYYAVQMTVMFMLYSGLAMAANLVTAKEDNTLMRLRSLPIAPWRLLAGKVAGNGAIMMVQAILIIAGSGLIYGVYWGNQIGKLVLLFMLLILFTLGMGVTVGILARTKRGVFLILQPALIVMTFLSGGFSPSIGETLSQLGMFTVSYWATQGLLRMMLETDPAAVLPYLFGLGCWTCGTLLVAAASFGKAGYHE